LTSFVAMTTAPPSLFTETQGSEAATASVARAGERVVAAGDDRAGGDVVRGRTDRDVAVVPPAGMSTLAGTVTAARLLDSVTSAPAAAAAPDSVIVPTEFAPAVIDAGATETEASVAAFTVNDA